MWIPSPSCATFLLLPVIMLGGCRFGGNNDRPLTGDPEFGDPYEIVLSEMPSLPDVPPAIERDSLHVNIRYPGGCRDHDFRVGYQSRADTARLWIHHNARGDDCEAMIFERLALPLGDTVDDPVVLLLDPNSDFPFVVSR